MGSDKNVDMVEFEDSLGSVDLIVEFRVEKDKITDRIHFVEMYFGRVIIFMIKVTSTLIHLKRHSDTFKSQLNCLVPKI